MIMPFFQLLGYDVFNPLEFAPEFTADVGIKKGEKVDYAIMLDQEPLILIECKPCNKSLDKHSSQLFRYFGTTNAKFAILTNRRSYQFYTDLEDKNKMDMRPFLTVDLLKLKDRDITEIAKFQKGDAYKRQLLICPDIFSYPLQFSHNTMECFHSFSIHKTSHAKTPSPPWIAVYLFDILFPDGSAYPVFPLPIHQG